MTTRRRFLANLGIGAAALMLRFRPESAAELPQHGLADGDYEIVYLHTNLSFERLPPTQWQQTVSRMPSLTRFTVKNGILTFE